MIRLCHWLRIDAGGVALELAVERLRRLLVHSTEFDADVIGRAGLLVGRGRILIGRIEQDVAADIVRAGRIEADNDVRLILAEEMRAVGAGKRGDIAGEGNGFAGGRGCGWSFTLRAAIILEGHVDGGAAAPCPDKAASGGIHSA